MREPKQGQSPIEDLVELRNYFSTHNVVREYIAHSSKVHSVGWSCDGRRLASGSFDKSVAIFNLERNRLKTGGRVASLLLGGRLSVVRSPACKEAPPFSVAQVCLCIKQTYQHYYNAI